MLLYGTFGFAQAFAELPSAEQPTGFPGRPPLNRSENLAVFRLALRTLTCNIGKSSTVRRRSEVGQEKTMLDNVATLPIEC